MTKKRKRSRPTTSDRGVNRKRPKTDNECNGLIPIEHPTLCLYYSRISTLRTYLLGSLPLSARSRRRKIASIGRHQQNAVENAGDDGPLRGPESERCLATLLDKTLVCTTEDEPRVVDESREKDLASFSQQSNVTARSSFEKETSPIAEVS